jgi:uncharacterized protein
MDERPQGIASIWPEGRPVIGMIHLLPLPGAPRWGGSMRRVLERARSDANALESAGFDGVLVENFLDAPFFAERVPPETIAAMTAAVAAVRGTVMIPVGVNVLRNDVAAALGVAAATGACFLRANVHTGAMWTDQGLIEGRAHDTLRLRRALGADVAILADVHVKHATPPAGARLDSSAADSWSRGLADALVVSGAGTGAVTDSADVRTVKSAVPVAPVIIGSGITPETLAEALSVADGAIVGSAIMTGGHAGAGIDPERALALMARTRG